MTAFGYPTAGVWFDFLHPDAQGAPTVGEIRNMPVNGVCPLRGPMDTGTFLWGSGAGDLVGEFGIGSVDFGQPIVVTFAGKSDFFEEELRDGAPTSIKSCDNVAIMVSLRNFVEGEALTFLLSITADQYATLESFSETSPVGVNPSGNATVGQAVVGMAVVGQNNAYQAFQIVRAFGQAGAQGRVLQVAWQEGSIYPWTVLGYVITLSSQEAPVP
jgi:hypothetical protein